MITTLSQLTEVEKTQLCKDGLLVRATARELGVSHSLVSRVLWNKQTSARVAGRLVDNINARRAAAAAPTK